MNILIIDDSSTTRSFVVTELMTYGYNVDEAVNGQDGLVKIEDAQPDIIILDLLMPVMDGFEVLEALKKQEYTIPVIVLSADIQEGAKQECFELGAAKFLSKPFNVDELLEAIKTVKP